MSKFDARPSTAAFNFAGHESWMESAACIGYPPDWWHTELKGPRQDETECAKRVCASCPVSVRCLDYALRTETNEWGRYGIWAGLTPEQRRGLGKESS